MIKKETLVIFKDGEFKGEHDWKGGIPLSIGEILKVNLNDKTINYILADKEVSCDVEGEDQKVRVIYKFKLDKN
ncbi:hypothetical protein COY27_04100 [Candidatus Woesearchaeota archaeon CG_4_10_14_0_2_um_filter_33_13]|nr:MAG: hypothetical protein COY27_04100 [Candidatus Woesearchaeota archaeon CG_4_10_14_0_2_um_filter_33_13]